MPTEADLRLDLATMPIADKVARYVHARSYAMQLRVLQGEAELCGCHFAVAASSDRMPAEVEEHLSFALMAAKSAEWAPAEPVSKHCKYALACLADGSGTALLRDILAALSALNICFLIGPAGLNVGYIESKRRFWGLSRGVFADALPTSLSDESSSCEVNKFVHSFFQELKGPSNGDH